MKNLVCVISIALIVGIGLIGCSGMKGASYKKINGAALYVEKSCDSCHGKNGDEAIDPTYPNINCQNAEYAKSKLIEIRDGKVKGDLREMKQPFLAGMTDDEIMAITLWLQSIPGC
jgi:cytochrome c